MKKKQTKVPSTSVDLHLSLSDLYGVEGTHTALKSLPESPQTTADTFLFDWLQTGVTTLEVLQDFVALKHAPINDIKSSCYGYIISWK